MVLDADRGRSGAAPSQRFWSIDFHGGELNSPGSGPTYIYGVHICRHTPRRRGIRYPEEPVLKLKSGGILDHPLSRMWHREPGRSLLPIERTPMTEQPLAKNAL